jgi:flagellar protein FlaD
MIQEKGMFKDLLGNFGKLKMPEESLIKKLEKIKKNPEAQAESSLPDVSDQLKKTQDELTKKVEEMVNSKTEQVKADAEAVKNLESQISRIDQIVSSGKKSTDEFKERLDKIDETVLELLSLYEVVSSTVNPFVSDKENHTAEKLADIEKKVEELSQKTPETPSNLIEDFDIKFKTFENKMEELKKIVESNVVNQEALVEKVAGLVVERIKPAGHKAVAPPIPQTAQPQAPTQKTAEASQYSEEHEIRLPFLDNKPETSIILLNWIEFLMEKVGRNNLIDVLEYYVEIGWISEEVSSKMIAYASGIDYYVERPTWKLLPEDHTKSLLFIEQLRGRKMDKNLLSKLERDVDKVIRSSEVLVL